MVASQFMPDTVDGYAPDVQPLPYDPDKAKQLLAEAGASNLTLNFYYPTEVTRPYMPNPTNIFTALSENLQAVGITVNPVPPAWNGGYLDAVQATGVPGPALPRLDRRLQRRAATSSAPSSDRPSRSSGSPTRRCSPRSARPTRRRPGRARRGLRAGQPRLMTKFLPAVPICSSPPAIVVGKNITGLVPVPLTDERFFTVSKG